MLSRYVRRPFERREKLLTINVIKGALGSVKPAAAKDGALGDHYRMALLELSVSSGLTMEQYRKKLDQNLAQTQTQLNNFLGKPDGLLLHPYGGGAAKSISTIEEGSEAEGSGSSANSHGQSHSSQSHIGSTQNNSDGGRRSLPRSLRILRRLLPSSMRRKEV